MDDKNIYPIQYVIPLQLRDGTLIQLRPIHPVDGQKAHEFKAKLSAKSIHDRFLGYIPNVSPQIVNNLTKIDYSKDMAIIAELPNANPKEIIAVARIASENNTEVDFAIIIIDEWQGRGLGSYLTKYLIEIAKDLKYQKVYATFFNHNIGMEKVFQKLGFEISSNDRETKYAELIF